MNQPQRQVIIRHPAFLRARDALNRALSTTNRGQIVFVVGLSGAGKSEIRYAVMRSLAGTPDRWPIGHLPVISVRATPSDRSNFNPKEFMARLYLELQDPNISWLVDRSRVDDPDEGHVRMESRLSESVWIRSSVRWTEHRLRSFVERTAITRGVKAIFVEEAGSLTYTQRHKHPGDHMVNYMCLAEEIGATLVMFGVPRIASLWEGNAEVLRRSRFVFVQRYRNDREEDRRHFERLALTLAENYRFAQPDLIQRSLASAYASSVGVFGEVDAFYRRADDLRASDKEEAICERHLDGAVSSETTLKTLYDDASIFDLLQRPASASAIRRMSESR
jgi:hypothetical protein